MAKDSKRKADQITSGENPRKSSTNAVFENNNNNVASLLLFDYIPSGVFVNIIMRPYFTLNNLFCFSLVCKTFYQVARKEQQCINAVTKFFEKFGYRIDSSTKYNLLNKHYYNNNELIPLFNDLYNKSMNAPIRYHLNEKKDLINKRKELLTLFENKLYPEAKDYISMHKINPWFADAEGVSPLCIVASHGNEDMIFFLLSCRSEKRTMLSEDYLQGLKNASDPSGYYSSIINELKKYTCISDLLVDNKTTLLGYFYSKKKINEYIRLVKYHKVATNLYSPKGEVLSRKRALSPVIAAFRKRHIAVGRILLQMFLHLFSDSTELQELSQLIIDNNDDQSLSVLSPYLKSNFCSLISYAWYKNRFDMVKLLLNTCSAYSMDTKFRFVCHLLQNYNSTIGLRYAELIKYIATGTYSENGIEKMRGLISSFIKNPDQLEKFKQECIVVLTKQGIQSLQFIISCFIPSEMRNLTTILVTTLDHYLSMPYSDENAKIVYKLFLAIFKTDPNYLKSSLFFNVLKCLIQLKPFDVLEMILQMEETQEISLATGDVIQLMNKINRALSHEVLAFLANKSKELCALYQKVVDGDFYYKAPESNNLKQTSHVISTNHSNNTNTLFQNAHGEKEKLLSDITSCIIQREKDLHTELLKIKAEMKDLEYLLNVAIKNEKYTALIILLEFSIENNTKDFLNKISMDTWRTIFSNIAATQVELINKYFAFFVREKLYEHFKTLYEVHSDHIPQQELLKYLRTFDNFFKNQNSLCLSEFTILPDLEEKINATEQRHKEQIELSESAPPSQITLR